MGDNMYPDYGRKEIVGSQIRSLGHDPRCILIYFRGKLSLFLTLANLHQDDLEKDGIHCWKGGPERSDGSPGQAETVRQQRELLPPPQDRLPIGRQGTDGH